MSAPSDMAHQEDFLRVKTFMAAMDWFNLSVTDKEKVLNDKRLTQAEKIILECSTLLRECKFQEIISALKDLITHNTLVEAQKCVVLGVAYNASCASNKAVPHFEKAIKVFRQAGLPKYEYNALMQLFFVHLNLKNKKELPEILDRMEETMSEDLKDKISYLRCRFNYHVFIADYAVAKSHLKRLEDLKDKMHPSQHIFHLVDKFIYYVKIDQFAKCEQTLTELKGHRRYRVSENFYFMQSLLAHYMHKKPIYLYEQDFKDFPLLLNQLKVIQMLESGNKNEAKKFWKELNALNSSVYCEFMDYQGDKCLFSLCLDLYQTKQAMDISSLLTPSLQPREKELLTMLSQSPTPVMKEAIYLKIWGKELESKDELAKLIMMVARIKKKTGAEIKSSKGCYLLVTKDSKKKAS